LTGLSHFLRGSSSR